ncbi:penicillin-binding transpeptidase domain-containing protein [Actinotalea sp. AC32]|nr:penicillin-binding transpeptidase domain-containing protein [Actinotalea sp. AC32]
MGLRTRARVGTAVVVGAVLVVAPVAACSPGTPDPAPVAAGLAAALAAGDLTGVPLGDTDPAAATEQLRTSTAALDPARPEVRVGDVVESEVDGTRTATATVVTTWDLDATGDDDWTYSADAHLTLVDDVWQVRWDTALVAPDLRPTETLTTRVEAAPRAPVLGAGDVALVEDRPVLRLGVDKTAVEVAAQADAARAVAGLLGLDPEGLADRVAAAGERAFVEALVVRTAEPGVDLAAFRAVPGALAVEDTLPLAPTRRFARPLLGTAGPATAEVVEESGGAVRPGDVVGLSGLQRQYDEQLRGTPGTVVAAVAEDGSERVLWERPPTPGEPLRTTIDPRVQDAAESVLEPVPSASAVVVVRASTGEVLAAASGPGSEGYSTATLATYAPGSVFKVVSSLALLRAGLTPDSPVGCPVTTTVDGREFSNFPGYPAAATGTVTLRTAVAHSCNTAFIGAREQASGDALARAAASLGLGVDADLGFPAFLGAVPGDPTGTGLAAAMIGQGQVQASPLAMAAVAASVARGATVVPRLLADAPAPAGSGEPLTETEAAALRDLMRAVVTQGGATFLADVPGAEVLAKTGTAQFGTGDDLANHAWMIAVHGDLAYAVVVEDGDYGSTTAGPLLEQLLTAVG